MIEIAIQDLQHGVIDHSWRKCLSIGLEEEVTVNKHEPTCQHIFSTVTNMAANTFLLPFHIRLIFQLESNNRESVQF